jgi:radical SAM protein with 4Fe4S-binding SPASM domain
LPAREQTESAARFIHEYGKQREEEENADGKMKLRVESCFSPLRAMMGGEDAKQNANRGVARGCTAGRDHFCVRPDGSFAPCADYGKAESYGAIMEYWDHSPVLNALCGVQSPDCPNCAYRRRCLPCPGTEAPCLMETGKQ